MGKKSRRPKAKKDKANNGSATRGKGTQAMPPYPTSIATYVPDTSSFGPSPLPITVTTFWDWFQKNQETLYEMPPMICSQHIDMKLMQVHSDLVYEIGCPGGDSTHHHLVISAGGIKGLFNTVISLIRAAPTDLDNWRFTAFRDRKPNSEDLDLSFEGKTYPQRHIQYALGKDDRPDKIGIWLFMKGFDDFQALNDEQQNYYQMIGYLYLDAILGEYDVEMHIGGIMIESQKDYMFKRQETYGLSQLAHDFDGWLSEKIGPKPKEGWSALANLGCPLDVGGGSAANKKSPTSVCCVKPALGDEDN